MELTIKPPREAHLADEITATITQVGNYRLHIHAWEQSEDRPRGEVYVIIGSLDEYGEPITDKDGNMEDFQNMIVAREDFINAVLAVLPELRRAV